jgi:hypothetical protein
MSMRSATNEKKYLWMKYLSQYENKHWQCCLSMHLCGMVDLTTGGPIFQQPYRAGPFARTSEQTEVNQMLAEDKIEPATSKWSSPVVLVPKRDYRMRL